VPGVAAYLGRLFERRIEAGEVIVSVALVAGHHLVGLSRLAAHAAADLHIRLGVGHSGTTHARLLGRCLPRTNLSLWRRCSGDGDGSGNSSGNRSLLGLPNLLRRRCRQHYGGQGLLRSLDTVLDRFNRCGTRGFIHGTHCVGRHVEVLRFRRILAGQAQCLEDDLNSAAGGVGHGVQVRRRLFEVSPLFSLPFVLLADGFLRVRRQVVFVLVLVLALALAG